MTRRPTFLSWPVFVVVMAALAARLSAGAWHVSASGNDSNNGSENEPFVSIKAAVEAATKADGAAEIIVHAGVYPGDVIVPAPANSQTEVQALTIRAAAKPGGGFEEVVFDGGQKVVEAEVVDAERGVYFVRFNLSNFEPSMWETRTRTRYLFVADRRAVEAFPASLAPGRFLVRGEQHEGVFFHTSDGKPPAVREVELARDRCGLVVRRPNVTIKGLRFRNFQLYFGVQAISVEAANVTVESCQAWNCYGMVGVSEKVPDAKILNCSARDVASGVKSYGVNTVVENCRFFRVDDAFVVQENEQDQCGIQFYTSNIQTARGNLCVGFQAGIFIKASGGLLILENNTVVAPRTGGERGLGPNTWRSGSICRGNVVVGYEAPTELEGLKKDLIVSGNLFWMAANPKRADEAVAKIKADAGGDNVSAPPLFVDPGKEDFRLAPASVGATLGPNKQPIGAMGALLTGEADKTPPTLRVEVLAPAQPLGMRSRVYVRKNTWIGGKEPEQIEDNMLQPDQLIWMATSGALELRLRAEDTLGKLTQVRVRIGEGNWAKAEPFRETLKIELPKGAPATSVTVQVSDAAGNWSEPAAVRVTTAAHAPKLVGKPVITTSDLGAIVAFQTDVPCVATLEWGSGDRFDQRSADSTETQFRFDNSLGLEWTEHITGPRTNHCLAITSPVKTGESYSYRLKLGYDKADSAPVDEGRFTLKGPARTLHVATSGADAENGGSPNQPFVSIQFAVDRALPGDRVLVASGIYTGSVAVTHGGVEGHPIRIESAEPWGAVLDGKRDAGTGIWLSNVAHVQVSGFEMRWHNDTGLLAYNAQDILIERCKFWGRHWVKGRPGTADGMVAFTCKRVTLDGNLFFALNSAFRLFDTDGFRITNNTAARCFHRVASLAYSGKGYLRNNSFAFGSSFLLSMVLTDEQFASLDSDYNNFAVHLREDAYTLAQKTNKIVPPEELLTREDGDFYYGESKGLADWTGSHSAAYKAGATVEMPTLTEWRKVSGQDKHSIAIHPRYADPQNRDFRLLPRSPNAGAGEKGTNVGALGVVTKERM